MKNPSAEQSPGKPSAQGFLAVNEQSQKPSGKAQFSAVSPSAKIAPDTAQVLNQTAAKMRDRKDRALHADGAMEAKKDLNDTARRFIVESLASYVAPMQVIKDVQELFGVELTKQRLQLYDPTKANGRKLRPELRELFTSTRASYLRGIQNVGIANQRYRLESLQEEHGRAKSRGNSGMVMQLLEHAAREIGGCFTNHKAVADDDSLAFLAKLLDIPIEHLPPPCPPRHVKRKR